MIKCEHCGCEERVPVWILKELNEFTSDKTHQMSCPECDYTMYQTNKII